MKLSDIATALNARLVGDGAIEIDRPVNPADAEGPRDLALAMEPGAFELLKSSPARAAVLREGTEPPAGRLEGYLLVGRARYAMARILELFDRPVHAEPGVHPSAVIGPGAEIGRGVRIGPHCVVGPRARIGARTTLVAQVTVGAEAAIGEDCLIHPGARIGERVVLGHRVILQNNASIGADGFSFVTPELASVESAKETGALTAKVQDLVRINSIGTVVLGDDVEVGANSCIDRGTVSTTRIGRNTKIDDLVMIGHNCVVGENCMLCGQSGVAGSTVLGDRVVLGARVGVGDHVTIGNDTVLAGGALIGHNVPPRSLLVGIPPLPRAEAYELHRNMRRLGRLFEEVAALKKRVEGK
ncbi:MAG TPA: UDP-3-O-(3-hydroxymyristoyl)glucosamine N-acyltransferase [Alphaproteobacteria bacterium]|nr:UDP-3-O-(3-hydroxymyristoyl)glucosamine N-acyltransferase [Alphaproteobacteria bacterium]